jgi:hypothetical protein
MGSTSAAGPSTGPGRPENGSSTTEQAKQKVEATTQQAAGEARGRLQEQVDQCSTQAGEQLAATADDVRGVARQGVAPGQARLGQGERRGSHHFHAATIAV